MRRPAPLAVWLVIQTLTLVMGATRLPLWARSGAAPQQLALAEMVVVQFVTTTLLFPWLLSGAAGIAVAFTAVPFLQLAAFLTSTPLAASAAVSIHLILWIIGLSGLSSGLRSKINRSIAMAILSAVVI